MSGLKKGRVRGVQERWFQRAGARAKSLGRGRAGEEGARVKTIESYAQVSRGTLIIGTSFDSAW